MMIVMTIKLIAKGKRIHKPISRRDHGINRISEMQPKKQENHRNEHRLEPNAKRSTPEVNYGLMLFWMN